MFIHIHTWTLEIRNKHWEIGDYQQTTLLPLEVLQKKEHLDAAQHS